MGSIGAPELIIVLLVVVLLFGSTKLPKLARSIGEASKEFKKGVDEGASGATEASPPAKTETVNMTKAEQEEFEAFKAFKAQREADRKDSPPAQ